MGQAKSYIFKPNIKKLQAKKDIQGLINVLKFNKNNQTIESSSAALGNIGEPAIYPLLQEINLISDSLKKKKMKFYRYHKIEKALINSIKCMNKTAKNILITYMEHEYPNIRALSLKIISDIDLSISIEILLKALEDEYASVRSNAAYILIDMKEEKAIKSLLEALKDNDPTVRENASVALGNYKRKDFIEPLLKLLKDKEEGPRYGAAWGLGTIGDVKAIDPLILALNDKSNWVRTAAARSLGELGDKIAIEHLIKALNDDDGWVRGAAAKSLGKLYDEKTYDSLVELLKDKDYDVRKTVVESLGLIDVNKTKRIIRKTMNFQVINSIGKQEIKTNFKIILLVSLIFPLILIISFLTMNSIERFATFYFIPDKADIWVTLILMYMCTFVFALLLYLLVFIIFALGTRKDVEVHLDQEFDYWGNFYEVLGEKISSKFEIIKKGERFFHLKLIRKGKAVKVGICESHRIHVNKFALYINNFKYLDSSDQKTLLNLIQEGTVNYLLKSEE